MIVSEISRASVDSLDEAVAGDVGAEGSYSITMRAPFAIGTEDALERIGSALGNIGLQIKQSNEILGEFTPDCPPYEQLGSVQVALHRDGTGAPAKLSFGNDTLESELCVGGIRLPSAGFYFPNDSAQQRLGSYFFVHQQYVPALTGTGQGTHRLEVQLVTGSTTDDSVSIAEVLNQEFLTEMSFNALHEGDIFDVIRTNQGAEVREASRGVRVMYGIIGWGILGVSMIGLLISENIVVRQRSWFFGLIRSMGASRLRVGCLVLIDVLLVTVLGLLIATICAVLAQSSLASFIIAMTGVQEVRLFRGHNFARVSFTVLIVLSTAAIIPAWHATRQDPLEVLEPKRT